MRSSFRLLPAAAVVPALVALALSASTPPDPSASPVSPALSSPSPSPSPAEPAVDDGPPCPPPSGPPELGTRRSRWLLFENAPIHAMEVLPERDELWVVNPGGASLAVVSLTDERVVAEVAVGLGPVAVRRRPGSDELWAVCQSSNAVFVIDAPSRRVVDVLPVAHEPTDVAFDPSGERAFVVTSTSDQVNSLDATRREPVGEPVLLDAPVDARWFEESSVRRARVQEPRRLIYAAAPEYSGAAPEYSRSGYSGNGYSGNDELLVLVHRSGNGSTTDSLDRDGDRLRFEVVDPQNFGDPPIPDADILGLTLGDAGSHPFPTAPRIVAEAVGTVLYDAERDAGGRLWVTSTDLRNQDAAGLFRLRRQGFVRPRLSLIEEDGGENVISHVDLAADRLPILPDDPDHQCATPTDLLLAPDGRRAYVACYGSRNVAVVDTGSRRVVALLRADLGSPDPERGFGPRGLALHGDALYVYHRGDQVLQRFPVPADGEVRGPEATLDAGSDPTPEPVVAGRHHFIDARRSVDGLRSCDSCHVDGQTDGLAWTMSDYGGDLDGVSGAEPHLRVSFPQTKTTQDLRNAEERPPYHWFGDRHDLADFALLFVGLLGAPEPDAAALAKLDAYVFSLTLPPNPSTPIDRSLSPEALAGYGCFETGAVHHTSTHRAGIPALGGAAEGRIRVSCQDCHAMAGGLTSNNQLTNDARFPVPGVPSDLRGLFDKRATVLVHGGKRWASTGWGFGSSGVFASTAEFTEATFRGEVTLPQIAAIERFLEELDSGTAPLATFAAPLDQAPMERLRAQAAGGWLDLVVRRGDSFSYVLTTPPGMARRLSLDPSDPVSPDPVSSDPVSSDPVSSDPVSPDSAPGPLSPEKPSEEKHPPRITDARIEWSASTVAHVRFRTYTDAIARIRVVEAGGDPADPIWSGESFVPERDHAFIARGLAAGGSFELLVDAVDSAGRRSEPVRLAVTMDDPLFPYLAVPETGLRLVLKQQVLKEQVSNDQAPMLEATFRVTDERRRAVAGARVHFHLLEWGDDGRSSRRELVAGPTEADGVARLEVRSTRPAGTGGFAEISVDRRWDRGVVDPKERLYFYPGDLELGHWARVELP